MLTPNLRSPLQFLPVILLEPHVLSVSVQVVPQALVRAQSHDQVEPLVVRVDHNPLQVGNVVVSPNLKAIVGYEGCHFLV